MAKKITAQEYSEYEKILRKYQKMRRNIVKSHNIMTESSPVISSRLPQLVAPERQFKIKFSAFKMTGRRIFSMKMRQLRKLVNKGEKGFYKDFKSEYLGLWRQYIFEEKPLAGGYFSKEQISNADFSMRKAMHVYNRMQGLPPELFMWAYNRNFIKSFRYYYNEFSDKARYVAESFIDDTEKFMDMLQATPKEQKEFIINLLDGKFDNYKGYLNLNMIYDNIVNSSGKATDKQVRKTKRTFSPKKVAGEI